jgi:two-component system OmpR family sensor kinase
MTFRLRLALLIAVLVTFLLVASGSAFVVVSQRIVRQSVDRELRMRVHNLAGAMRQPRPDFEDQQRPPAPPNMPGFAPRFFPAVSHQDESAPEPYDAGALQRVAPGGEVFSDTTIDGMKVRVITLGLREGDKAQAVYNMEDVDRLGATQTTLVLFSVPIAVLLAAGLAWFLADQAVQPLERITAAAAKVSQESLGSRIPVSGNDEVAALARQFNLMLGRLEVSFQQRETLLRQVQAALESQTAFVADASHELRTPLARMKLLTSSALHQETDLDGLRAVLTKIDRGADDMNALIAQLLLLARHDSPTQTDHSNSRMSEVYDRAAALTEAVPGPPSVWGEPSSATVRGRPEDLGRVLANVVENAKKYAPDSPEIVISGREDHDTVTIAVQDHGPGIAAEHLPRLTERFYRADASRTRSTGGTGLGLAIVKAVLESNGGAVKVESTLGQGTTVLLTFRKVV